MARSVALRDHRRQGIGTALAEKRVEYAKSQGARIIRSAARMNNMPSRLYFRSMGFISEGSWVPEGLDIPLRKRIPSIVAMVSYRPPISAFASIESPRHFARHLGSDFYSNSTRLKVDVERPTIRQFQRPKQTIPDLANALRSNLNTRNLLGLPSAADPPQHQTVAEVLRDHCTTFCLPQHLSCK